MYGFTDKMDHRDAKMLKVCRYQYVNAHTFRR